MGLLPKLTKRGQADGERSLYNPLNKRQIILSIREDYSKRLAKLNESSVKNKKVKAMYTTVLRQTYRAEKNKWKLNNCQKLKAMVDNRSHLKQVAYKSMEKLEIIHKGRKYQVPIIKSVHTDISKWGNKKVGLAFANLRTKGEHAKELKNFLE